MKTSNLGKTGITPSQIAFGGIMLSGLEQSVADRIVAEAVERGVTYFDVAPSYGNAQSRLGPALEPYRKDVYLACKTLERTAKGARAHLEESKTLLKTDYFDVYQFHGVNTDDEIDAILAPGGALEMAVKAKEAGEIGHIGFSSHNPKAAMRLIASFDFETVLFPINWAYWLGRGAGEDVMKAAKAKEMGFLAIKALAKRPLQPGEKTDFANCWYYPICDDRELAKMALAFTLSRGADVAVTPGDARMLKLMLELEEEEDLTFTDAMLDELKKRAAEQADILFDGQFA